MTVGTAASNVNGAAAPGKTVVKLVIFSALTIVAVSTAAILIHRMKKKQSESDQPAAETASMSTAAAETEQFKPESIPDALIKSEAPFPESQYFTPNQAASRPQRIAFCEYARKIGNQCYKDHQWKEAIQCYTKGIQAINWPEGRKKASIYFLFGNRAACHLALHNFAACVEDCSAALKEFPGFAKAYERRAKAWESLKKPELVAKDLVALSILEGFKVESTLNKLEALLKEICSAKANKIISTRSYFFPSAYIIQEYLEAFPLKNIDISQFPSALSSAFASVENREYEKADKLFHEAVEQMSAEPEKEFISLANEMAGTFDLLKGNLEAAKSFFDAAIALNPRNSNAKVKISNYYLELAAYEQAMQTIDEVKKIDPLNPVVNYHEGELLAMVTQFEAAAECYSRAISLDPDFVLAYVHKARALIGLQRFQDAKILLSEALKRHPSNAHLMNCLAEAEAFASSTAAAMERLQEASRLMPENPTIWLNMSLIHSNNPDGDMSTAIEMLKIAIEKDPKFEAAYSQLGSIYLQLGEHQKAFEALNLAVKNSRNIDQLISTLMLLENAKIQLEVCNSDAFLNEKFGQLVFAAAGGGQVNGSA